MIYANDTIETSMKWFKPAIGKDETKYKNHVYRVFLNCLLMDEDKNNEEKYAIAAVFHDIGIWTDHTIDYLDPSIKQAKHYLIETNRQEWIAEINSMIFWHHKTKKYKGHHTQTTETFRKADWMDVSLGLLTYGNDKKRIRSNRKTYPNAGFHWFLFKKIFSNFFRHPLNPLPMFKK